jgi:excisionase family DNA binding protein
MDGVLTEYQTKVFSDVEAQETNALLTAGKAAQLLNVHINTIRKWSNLGILKSFRIGPRGDRRFRKEDVYRFLME